MKSRFTEVADDIVEALADGLTLEDACLRVGIPTPTVKSWLQRGRRDVEGAYFEFAARVDEAREQVAAAPMDEAELVSHVARMVRRGSVAAARLLWEMRLASEDDRQPDAVDALVARRAARLNASGTRPPRDRNGHG